MSASEPDEIVVDFAHPIAVVPHVLSDRHGAHAVAVDVTSVLDSEGGTSIFIDVADDQTGLDGAGAATVVRSDNSLDDPFYASVVQGIVAGIKPDFVRLNKTARELRDARQRLSKAMAVKS